MKHFGVLLLISLQLVISSVRASPLWGVDWKTAPYSNRGTDHNPEVVLDRIFDAEPALPSDILKTLKTLDTRYFRQYAYDIMLKPESSSADAFNLGGHIVEHFQEQKLAQNGNAFALERLITRVAASQGFSQRAHAIQKRYNTEIKNLRDPRIGIESRMRTYRGMNTTREQQAEFLKTMERDFASNIAAYDQAQIDNKRIKNELREEETQLISDFWQNFSEALSQEWQRTNSNMTYKGIIEDSFLNELSGITDEQKEKIKELGLTPHFFDEFSQALSCHGDVSNIIDELEKFRTEQSRLAALLQAIQNTAEEPAAPVQKEEEATLLAATGETSAENFDTAQEDVQSLEREKLLSETVMKLNSLFETPVDILQSDLDTRNVGVENETYLRELFGLEENDQFPRTVKQFNRRLEEMLARVKVKGGDLPPGLTSAQEIILHMPQPQYNVNETQESMGRKFEDLANQSVLTYNPQTGQFEQKLMIDVIKKTQHLPEAGSVSVSIQRGMPQYNSVSAGPSTTVMITSVSVDGKKLNNVWYNESENGSGVQNQSHTLEELQKNIYNNANSNVIRDN